MGINNELIKILNNNLYDKVTHMYIPAKFRSKYIKYILNISIKYRI